MVSFWPWKGEDSSPASFEKALSKLSAQISSATLALETTRGRHRRLKGLWTLYTVITYLVYTLIVTVVIGPHNWSYGHYGGLLGAPLVIYGVRKGITLVFDWRAAKQQAHLDALQKQQESKIADLKKATKFDSTQELLQKYGGAPKQTPSKSPQSGAKRKVTPSPTQGRTGIAPPPTANIPGRVSAGASPSTPQRPNVSTSPASAINTRSLVSSAALVDSPANATPNEPGFAPNAFGSIPPPPRSAYDQTPRWYDRIMDVLLGEDETLAKNRLALICYNCRLVNGQAPPGVKTFEELGRWRCSSCGAWNGMERSETTKLVEEMKERAAKDRSEGWEKVSRGNEEAGSPDSGVESSVVNRGTRQIAESSSPKVVKEIADSEADDDEEDGEVEAEQAEHNEAEEEPQTSKPTPLASTSNPKSKRVTRSSTSKQQSKDK